MANRAYIIPRRNDLSGLGISLVDLKPNAGQKNSVYDGTHQNIYVRESLDFAGTTVVSGISYVSGSKNTTLTANAVNDDTTGGGNDVAAMQATSFGLASYIKDRVHGGGVANANNPEVAFADCNTIAGLILADVHAGVSLTLARINVHLAATVANTDLDGAAANSKSFGSVEDILRILSGEVYRLPALTIIEALASDFQSLAERQAFVDAQTPAMIATQGRFYASGGFLGATDPGYQARPVLAAGGALNASLLNGVLSGLKTSMNIFHPDFAYSAGEVTAWRPRARNIVGTAIPTSGAGIPVAVYLNDGTVL